MRSPFDTEERQAFRSTLREFVEREIRPHADAWDEAGEVPWALHRKAGQLGLDEQTVIVLPDIERRIDCRPRKP